MSIITVQQNIQANVMYMWSLIVSAFEVQKNLDYPASIIYPESRLSGMEILSKKNL